MQAIILLVFLLFTPLMLGLPWAKKLTGSNVRGYLLCLPLGYFLQTAVFQFLEMPFAWSGFSFSSLCIVFIVAIVILCLLSILWSKKLSFQSRETISWTPWTALFAITFIGLLIYQLILALTMDRTYMSYDDARYVTFANDALTHNTLFVTEAYTGLREALDIHRTIQSSLVYPAFLSYVSGVPVVLMEHTILDVYYILLAYITHAYMSAVLFSKLSDRFAFLIILSVVYIYGNYSIYSPTMRLLGLNYVGKAILAYLFFPLLLSTMVENLGKTYSKMFGIVLLLLSASASGLTMFGTVTMVANVCLPVVISLFFKKRQWKKLIYIVWGCTLPAIYAGIFFAARLIV